MDMKAQFKKWGVGVFVVTINSAHQLLELENHSLNPRLSKSVVVLNSVKQLGKAPEAICLNLDNGLL